MSLGFGIFVMVSVVFTYLCLYSLIDRVCRCFERCSAHKYGRKYEER